MNLIEKMISKLADKKVGKKLLEITIVGSMAFNTAATLAACDKPKTEDVDPKSGYEQSLDPIENPTEDPENEVVHDTSSEYILSQVDLNQYSAPLQKVLSDEYYMNLRNVLGKDVFHGANKLKAIPYGNLNSLGYSNEDIYNILNDQYFAESFVYIKDGDLYIAFNAEHKPSSEVYCGSFLLKYTLTDQELYELKALHRDLWNCNSTYLEAPLFIQAMSQLKTPEVLSRAYITKDALNETLNKINERKASSWYNNYLKYPKLILFNKSENIEGTDPSISTKRTITIFCDNIANAISNNARYLSFTSNQGSLSKYIDGKFVVINGMNYTIGLSKTSDETYQSIILPITRLDSNKYCASLYCAIDNWDINYLKNINYTNELNKE